MKGCIIQCWCNSLCQPPLLSGWHKYALQNICDTLSQWEGRQDYSLQQPTQYAEPYGSFFRVKEGFSLQVKLQYKTSICNMQLAAQSKVLQHFLARNSYKFHVFHLQSGKVRWLVDGLDSDHL